MPLRSPYWRATLVKLFSRAARSTTSPLWANSASSRCFSSTRWSRLSGSASGRAASMVASRLRMESGVRLRPRRGLVDSSASRYCRTMRPSSRPLANAALWSADIGVFLRALGAVAADMFSRFLSWAFMTNRNGTTGLMPMNIGHLLADRRPAGPALFLMVCRYGCNPDDEHPDATQKSDWEAIHIRKDRCCSPASPTASSSIGANLGRFRSHCPDPGPVRRPDVGRACRGTGTTAADRQPADHGPERRRAGRP